MLGIDPGDTAVGPLSAVTLSDGRGLDADDAGQNVAVLDATYAAGADLAVGDTIDVGGTGMEVVGIVSSTSDEADTAANVYIPLDVAQALAGVEDVVSTVYVQAASADEIDAVQTAIAETLPDATVSSQSDLASTVSGSLSSASALISNLGTWLSVIVLVVALALAVLFTISGVSRRTREFGTLKAIGWSNGRVVGQVAGESVAQGLIGGAVGPRDGSHRDLGDQSRSRPRSRARRRPGTVGDMPHRSGWRRPGIRQPHSADRRRPMSCCSAPLSALGDRRRDRHLARRRVARRRIRRLAGRPPEPGRSTAVGRMTPPPARTRQHRPPEQGRRHDHDRHEQRRAARMPSLPVLYRLSGVTRTYQQRGRTVRALAGVDLEIAEGEFVAIQGPTGGGKSTLLQLLGALDAPSGGSVVLGGTDIATASQAELGRLRAEQIGFVFQGFNLIPTLTAHENVDMALEPLGRCSQAARACRHARRAKALAHVGLADRADHRPGELSGGQQQRVAIARAIVKRPRVLLADEPTGNLDESMRDEIIDVLQTLNDEGLTLIVVTHDSAVAERAHRRLRLDKGAVREITR